MTIHNPPANDAERLQNMLAALAALDADDDTTDEEARARAEAQGVDFAAWGAAIKAQATAQHAAEREAAAGRAGGGVEAEASGGREARPVLSQVRDEEVLRDGPASANDVEAVILVAQPGRRPGAWSRLRRLARAVVVGLAAAGLVAVGSLALRWASLLGAPLARKITGGAAYAPAALEGTASSATARSQQGTGEAPGSEAPGEGE